MEIPFAADRLGQRIPIPIPMAIVARPNYNTRSRHSKICGQQGGALLILCLNRDRSDVSKKSLLLFSTREFHEVIEIVSWMEVDV